MVLAVMPIIAPLARRSRAFVTLANLDRQSSTDATYATRSERAQQSDYTGPAVYLLQSAALWRHYIGPFDTLLSVTSLLLGRQSWSSHLNRRTSALCIANWSQNVAARTAFNCHASQRLWFRQANVILYAPE